MSTSSSLGRSNDRQGGVPACSCCTRGFNREDTAAIAAYQQHLKAEAQHISDLVAQAESRARHTADAEYANRDNAEIKRLKTLLVEKDQAADETIRLGVEAGVAADRLANERQVNDLRRQLLDQQNEHDRKDRARAEELEKMKRKLEAKSPEELGISTQHHLAREMGEAFRGDSIRETKHGEKGADVFWGVKEDGKVLANAICESKNNTGWQEGWVTTLRATCASTAPTSAFSSSTRCRPSTACKRPSGIMASSFVARGRW
jgi:exonuclease VII large subunit